MVSKNKRKIPRTVKSIRISMETWENWENFNSKNKVSRTNLLETLFHSGCPEDLMFISQEEIKKLEESLRLRSNAGGAIKAVIRDVLSNVRGISKKELFAD